jgi:hypothetical protein
VVCYDDKLEHYHLIFLGKVWAYETCITRRANGNRQLIKINFER